jgi:hypothetical protein
MSFYYVRSSPGLSPEVEGIVLNTEHAEQAINHLIEFFRKGPRNQAYLRAVCTALQDLEQLFFDLYQQSFLSNAEGVQLDQLGEIVGEARQDRTDVQYRAAIRVRVLVNRSSGRLEELLTIADLYCRALGDLFPSVVAAEQWPAGLRFDVRTLPTSSFGSPAVAYLLGLLRRAKPAGVGCSFTAVDRLVGFTCATRAATPDVFGCGSRDGLSGGILGFGR